MLYLLCVMLWSRVVIFESQVSETHVSIGRALLPRMATSQDDVAADVIGAAAGSNKPQVAFVYCSFFYIE